MRKVMDDNHTPPVELLSIVIDIMAAMTNFLGVETDKRFVWRQYIVGMPRAAEHIHAKIIQPIGDKAFDAGLEEAALYHDGEAERIRQICRPLTLAPIAAIYAHDEAAITIRALKRGAPSEG
jgi:hypothetical protein